jgi:hypothetical protein
VDCGVVGVGPEKFPVVLGGLSVAAAFGLLKFGGPSLMEMDWQAVSSRAAHGRTARGIAARRTRSTSNDTPDLLPASRRTARRGHENTYRAKANHSA